MKNLILILVAMGVSTLSFARGQVPLQSCDLAETFVGSLDLWDQSADDLNVDLNKNGFKFTDNKKRILSCSSSTVSLFGVKVMETRLFFTSDRSKVEHVEFTLYNRGDAEVRNALLTRDEFKSLLGTVVAKLSDDGKAPKVVPRKLAKVKTYVQTWSNRVPPVELKWGLSGSKGAEIVEFAMLKVFRGQSSDIKDKKTGGVPRGAGKKGIDANVKKTDEGDVYVANVPMVDQGRKGYCSVAAAERVLRYYGNDISEHEIAQMAESSGIGGTEISAMIASVETIGRKCGLGKVEVVSNMRSWDDAANRLAKYNQAAKKMKRPELNINAFITQQGNVRTFHVGEMEQTMEPKVLKTMAMKDGAGYKRFLSGVKAQIDQGIPLFWSVRLGVYPEPECPQASGGHMRLVVGYNAETKEILYSDTWGAGHELKRMPQDWAWTITGNLLYLKP